MGKNLLKQLEIEDIAPVDGKCPEGYHLSDDATKCIADDLAPSGEPTGSAQESKKVQFDIKNESPNFVVVKPFIVKLENNLTLKYESDEKMTIGLTKQESIRIGTAGNCLVIDNAKVVESMFSHIAPLSFVKYQESEMSIVDAMASDLATEEIVNKVLNSAINEESELKIVNKRRHISESSKAQKIAEIKKVKLTSESKTLKIVSVTESK